MWNGSDYEWGAGGATSLDGLSDARVADSSIGIGSDALANDDGTNNINTAVGGFALNANTSGIRNAALGYQALLNNTTGANNVAVGQGAALLNTTGQDNVAIGRIAMSSNVSGGENVAVGYQALFNSTVGQNVAVGYDAGSTITTGTNLTVLGHNAEPSSATATNEVTLGNTSVDKFRIPGLQSSASDGDILTYNSSIDEIELQPSSGLSTGKAIAMYIVFGG